MSDSPNPTPTELRELARRWTAPHAPHPLIGAAACDVCLAGAEILSFPRLGRQIVALVDRLEDLARLVPNCDLPDTMPTTDDVMHTPLEPKHD